MPYTAIHHAFEAQAAGAGGVGAAGLVHAQPAPDLWRDALVDEILSVQPNAVIWDTNAHGLGGGCELAMMCDMIYAADTARFGQPEIKLGVIPGMGGSQRLTRLVGKAKAMDLILTGRTMGAEEAERAGLVARVIPADQLMPETLAAAQTIAGYSKTTAMMAREAVDRALETTLHEGLLFERRTYHALWATADQSEGMRAFIEKRTPRFTGR